MIEEAMIERATAAISNTPDYPPKTFAEMMADFATQAVEQAVRDRELAIGNELNERRHEMTAGDYEEWLENYIDGLRTGRKD